MKFDNQLRHATSIISSYKGEMPLHVWLKDFFRENRQMGSRDRKLLSHLAYCYYRLGHALKELPVPERMLAGLFLCNGSPHEILEYFKPEWNAHAHRTLEERVTMLQEFLPGFAPDHIFPWKEELSDEIDHKAFCLSFLRQPDLFLRVRPGFNEAVAGKLAASTLVHEWIPPFTVRLPNGSRIEELFTPDKEIVVQDYSSQRIASFLGPALCVPSGSPLSASSGSASSTPTSGAAPDSAVFHSGPTIPHPTPLSVWDACAASGGKSILAYDLNPTIDLTVSDIRESILRNLLDRFQRAGIRNYRSFTADLAEASSDARARKEQVLRTNTLTQSAGSLSGTDIPGLHGKRFDLIIADVPCSGSGTWSRTPEQLYFFDSRQIDHYSDMQRRITARLLPYLASGGSLVYITCSVFRKENEEIAACIRNSLTIADPVTVPSTHLHADQRVPGPMGCIAGYELRADTLFAARF